MKKIIIIIQVKKKKLIVHTIILSYHKEKIKYSLFYKIKITKATGGVTFFFNLVCFLGKLERGTDLPDSKLVML